MCRPRSNRGIASLIFLVTLNAWGCATPRPNFASVQIDSAFSPSQAEVIIFALDDWSSRTPFRYRVEPCTDASPACIVYRHADKLNCTDGCIGITQDNYHVDGTSYVSLLVTPVFRQNVLHETGHALGMGHDVAGTIMAEDAKHASVDITDRDVNMYCEVHQCGD